MLSREGENLVRTQTRAYHYLTLRAGLSNPFGQRLQELVSARAAAA